MRNVEADQSCGATNSGKADLGVVFAYVGLAICMLAAIYAASRSPGTALGDFASMTAFP
jgi:hypothetical protein